MPKPELSQRELADVTAAILQLEDTPPFEQISLPLKPLERKVSFSEVRTRVFDRVCRHCHTNERKTGGEAGAGNTGGFGYPGKGLDLSSESGIRRGVLDSSSGKRVSVISANSGELPLVVRTLVARHSELRGEFNSGVTGMPLGFAPIAEEDIRVIYTWCLQEGES